MTSEEIRKSFLDFFNKKGHAVVPSSSLIPSDPSVLLTTAGMQQFKPYFTGELNAEKDFGGLRTTSIQKSFRTSDIDEVGDTTHLTFFEMLGNFSFGDYFKEDAIHYAYEFVTEILGIDPKRITVTVFAGDHHGENRVPYDQESFNIWHKKIGLAPEKIAKHGREDNFWGPTGTEGPCGPTTEIYVDSIEIWNLVFNEYYQNKDKTLKSLASRGVDTGMGFERLVSVIQGVQDVFETDLLHPLMTKISELAPTLEVKCKRILADHLRASVFLISDGIRPSNKEAGYILRKLLRRMIAYKITHQLSNTLFQEGFELVNKQFGKHYEEVKDPHILEVMQAEEAKFEKVIENGLKEIKKYNAIDGKLAFEISSTYGMPFELILEMAPESVTKKLDKIEFEKEFKKHQETSRAGMEKKFGGHGLLLDTGELKAGSKEELQKVLRLHTATHLMQAALREVLGRGVEQMGSDITPERTRFDFTFERKMTDEEKERVETLVNGWIQKDVPMGFQEMPLEEAKKTGALHFFKAKYPDKVKIYYIGHDLESAISKEFCGGPHVTHTGEIGSFKIKKEEAVAAGVRRIRGVVD
ncbi:MAG: alanine--tRNA ligase [Candidatus Harrisonbacteria bacterium CG10_big_fil_rev_8_21_14_0_10_42_17]|uniref:alanine--tRNA ligase n=1 Tax=Candidatus Harrisonbacteria bacterium CG10_big_fil_rev_8_21_14_0_10_42_17 TaxID=1974584 RepID=A0A2M6WHY6_9BACT|nr:MAG: alanine--tRNA ligase [Candidatus Harrisonbacteria bacterium CG10_big_fil_rev_8_21_14_0_10_42_17]